MNLKVTAESSHFFQKEIKMEIMSCDLYFGVIANSDTAVGVEHDIAVAIAMFEAFQTKFSRFIYNNELYRFNCSSGWIQVSAELYDLLTLAKKYYQYTSGIFDISVYQNLLKEGYDKSFKDFSSVTYQQLQQQTKRNFTELQLQVGKVYKPADLMVEFGGIGKSYMVQKVAAFLSAKYQNFIVDAGGDIYFSGVDIINGYPYWACDIENPNNKEHILATLMLSNKGVATSGINRRNWLKNSAAKNHLINPATGKSVGPKILTVTVVADDIVFADVMAKSLLIMGEELGLEFCAKNNIAAFYVDNELRTKYSNEMQHYLWQTKRN